jgi:hypothetical protein
LNYLINQAVFKYLVSSKDFDGLLSLYFKTFIVKYSKLLSEEEKNFREKKELLETYKTTTVGSVASVRNKYKNLGNLEIKQPIYRMI